MPKSTKSKTATLTFASLTSVERTRGTKSSDGGRFNPKTRRLVVPTSFAGKKCDVKSGGGVVVVVVDEAGKFACHPAQHFVTLPAGMIEVKDSVTLAKTSLADLPKNAVAYKLPEA